MPPSSTDRTFSAYYRNHAGVVAWRTITPMEVWYGTTEWHKQPQWFLKAQDHSRNAIRDFALSDFLGDQEPAPEQVRNGDFKAQLDEELKELSKRASNLGYQIVSNEEGNLLGASLTVGNGLQVYGAMEALGRVQNYILASSRHPVEQADTNRSLAKALVQTEAQLLAAQDKIEELTKLLMNSKTPGG